MPQSANSAGHREPLRSEYLQLLGVRQWNPRYRLPCAAESKPCEWAEPAPAETLDRAAAQSPTAEESGKTLATAGPEDSPPAQESGLPVEAHTPATTSPAQAAMLEAAAVDDVFAEPKPHPDSAKADATQTEAVTPAKEPVARFFLQFALLPGDLLIVDYLDMAIRPAGHTDSHRRLLRNILLALVPGGGADSMRFESLRWPAVDTGRLEQGIDEARQFIGAFERSKLMDGKPARVLMLGECRPYLQDLACANLPCLASPVSLETMLQKPRTKALLWQALQQAGFAPAV